MWYWLQQHPTARYQNLYAFYPIINKADRFSARNNTSVLSHSSVGQKVNPGLTGIKSRDVQGWFPESMAPDSPPPSSQPTTSGVPFMLQISPIPSSVVYPFSDHSQRLCAFKHSSSYLVPMWITQANLLILKVLNLNHILESFLPCNVNYIGLEIRTWASWCVVCMSVCLSVCLLSACLCHSAYHTR